MKGFKYILLFIAALGLSSCEKNDPISELGVTNGEFSASLSVSYNNTRPAIGDTVVVTASTWQRDDKFDKVVFYETIVETFGVDITLKNGTQVITKDETLNDKTYSTLVITDTVKNKSLWNTVLAQDMDQYWTTVTNNYVIRQRYVLEKLSGRYPDDLSLIESLSEVDFAVLKSLLAYKINKDDYLLIFPTAPSTHYNNSGLTTAGMDYFRNNLTKSLLTTAVNSLVKKGTYKVIISVDAITPTGATTSSTPRIFENTI